ncbi:DUF898 family protein [Sneathiella aquimaris]|uniref:DUF898 family protein n=1 Tax=Sneathiella aquimaris TaxID=2599305 RepID=UPI00146C61B1|nr:DUF898 family protein [Sneathiella aquimaris]
MQSFVSVDISRRAVAGRLLINKILGIPTLGFYRFWGKTHLRRLLWQSIKIGEDRLQYHGTAKELFIGFLIALVIMTVIFTGLGVLLGIISLAGPQLSAVSSLLNFVVLYCFWQFALYRLWRYRLSRTSLRSIRFYLKGRAMAYMGKVFIWSVLSIVTLGWAYPKLLAVRATYMLNNLAFGDQDFHYSGRAAGFYKIYWPLILLGQFFVAGILGFLVISEELVGAPLEEIEQSIVHVGFLPQVQIAAGVGFVALSMMFLIARVQSFKYQVSRIEFAGASFRSELRFRKILVILVVMGVLGLVGYALIIGIFVSIATLMQTQPGVGIAVIFGLFLTIYLVMDIVMYLLLYIPLMKEIGKSLKTDDEDVFAKVAATSVNSPKYGEGLADALDVGAF